MRARTLILLFLAVVLAGSTALLARSWLAAERSKELEAAPMALTSISVIGRSPNQPSIGFFSARR